MCAEWCKSEWSTFKWFGYIEGLNDNWTWKQTNERRINGLRKRADRENHGWVELVRSSEKEEWEGYCIKW